MRNAAVDKWVDLIIPATGMLLTMMATAFLLIEKVERPEGTGIILSLGGVVAGVVVAISVISLARRRAVVFIAYSHTDQPLVKMIAQRLRLARIQVLLDTHELLVGDSIMQRIQELVDRADFIVVIFSQSWSDSDWAAKEFDIVLKSGKRILPVVIHESAVPSALRGVKFASVSEGVNDAIEQLITSIGKLSRNAKYDLARKEQATSEHQ